MKTVYIKRNELFKNINLFMMNNLENIDEDFTQNNLEIYCNDEDYYDLEVYQYFICNLDDYQKKQLNSYGVRFGYSEKLDCEVLPIYDFGTSWSCFSYSKEVENDYELEFNETLTRETVY